MSILQRSVFQYPDGREIRAFTMTNASGISVTACTYGCTITSLLLPDRNGDLDDVVLGYDRIEDYLNNDHYVGAVIGRYANRIAGGRFAINGIPYQVSVNHGHHHLHGGFKGFDKQLWHATIIEDKSGSTIFFSNVSSDGEEGFPGELTTRVGYSLGDDDTLYITLRATTTKKTIINLTQHSYFNLLGGRDTMLDHSLQINADHYLPVDSELIPAGELLPVTATPFDFREFVTIRDSIFQNHEQLRVANGFDHTLVLNKGREDLSYAATLWEKRSGRCIELFTTEPGLQLYTANFLTGTGKNNRLYGMHDGVCLECQHFPDSPNQSHFPSVYLEPHQTFESKTILKFSIR